jgi:multimeric flavodoxin WrbA
MKQNVLILSASPRKGGNSDLLCDQFMKGAIKSGNKVEKIFIQDKKINFCLGCMTCQTNGGVCIQDDDMSDILEKIIQADVLVMATPIYFYNMDAQLKVLIDRTCTRYLEITDKKAYLITTCADTNESASDVTIAGFRGFLDCLSNVKETGIISANNVTFVGDIKDKPEMEIAYQMGRDV